MQTGIKEANLKDIGNDIYFDPFETVFYCPYLATIFQSYGIPVSKIFKSTYGKIIVDDEKYLYKGLCTFFSHAIFPIWMNVNKLTNIVHKLKSVKLKILYHLQAKIEKMKTQRAEFMEKLREQVGLYYCIN